MTNQEVTVPPAVELEYHGRTSRRLSKRQVCVLVLAATAILSAYAGVRWGSEVLATNTCWRAERKLEISYSTDPSEICFDADPVAVARSLQDPNTNSGVADANGIKTYVYESCVFRSRGDDALARFRTARNVLNGIATEPRNERRDGVFLDPPDSPARPNATNVCTVFYGIRDGGSGAKFLRAHGFIGKGYRSRGRAGEYDCNVKAFAFYTEVIPTCADRDPESEKWGQYYATFPPRLEPQPNRLFLGAVEPTDKSLFTFNYECDTGSGKIEGKLNADNTVSMRVVSGPAKLPADGNWQHFIPADLK